MVSCASSVYLWLYILQSLVDIVSVLVWSVTEVSADFELPDDDMEMSQHIEFGLHKKTLLR